MREKMKYIKLILETLKVFIIFTGCTILFYYAIMWISEEYQNHQKYDEPEGQAVKVVSNHVENDQHNWFERLVLFYLNGE